MLEKWYPLRETLAKSLSKGLAMCPPKLPRQPQDFWERYKSATTSHPENVINLQWVSLLRYESKVWIGFLWTLQKNQYCACLVLLASCWSLNKPDLRLSEGAKSLYYLVLISCHSEPSTAKVTNTLVWQYMSCRPPLETRLPNTSASCLVRSCFWVVLPNVLMEKK